MEKMFPDISYNLSRNIIETNEKIKSLRDYSLNLHIFKIFKKSFDITKWSNRVSYAQGESGICPNHYKDWQEIEKSVKKELLTDLESKCCRELLKPFLDTKIHFIGMQMLNFLTKNPFLQIENASDFFPQLVSNSRGTINMLKSLKRFLKSNLSNFRTPIQDFQIACYLCSEKDIKPQFESLPDNVKENVAKYIENFPFIKFWLREAKINHPSMPETMHINLPDTNPDCYEEYFDIAINTNNEIAVEYLWTNKIFKLEDEGRAILEKSLQSIVDKPLKTNIMIFLLLQVNENEFVQFFQSSHLKVIENVVRNVRWHCVFGKIYAGLKYYFNDDSIPKIFGFLCNSLCAEYPSGMDLDMVVNYFSSLPDSDKISIVEESTRGQYLMVKEPYYRVLNKSIISRNKKCLQKLFEFENCTQLKKFFMTIPGALSLYEAEQSRIFNGILDLLRMVLYKRSVAQIKCNYRAYCIKCFSR